MHFFPLFLSILLASPCAQAAKTATITKVLRVKLPPVNVVHPTGVIGPFELFLAAEVQIVGNGFILGKPGLEKVDKEETTFSQLSGASKQLFFLMREAITFAIANKIAKVQLENGWAADQPISFKKRVIKLTDVPLSFDENKSQRHFAEALDFYLDAEGNLEKIEVKVKGLGPNRRFPLSDLQPVMKTLNPWVNLEWIKGVKATRDLTTLTVQTDKWLAEDLLLLRDPKSPDSVAEVSGCGGCGCIVVLGGAYALYRMIDFLF